MFTLHFQSDGGTYKGTLKQSFGGVGRNLADSLSRLGLETLFLSAIGDDSHKAAYEAHCSHMVCGFEVPLGTIKALQVVVLNEYM